MWGVEARVRILWDRPAIWGGLAPALAGTVHVVRGGLSCDRGQLAGGRRVRGVPLIHVLEKLERGVT